LLLVSDAPSYWFTLNTTMTAMIDNDDNDNDDDGYNDDGRQLWRRLPAQVPFDGVL
jgi:hypothetical protein